MKNGGRRRINTAATSIHFHIGIAMKAIAPSFVSIALCLAAAPALAQEVVVKTAPPGPAATTIYRQVLPDGRIVYSDKAVKGARIDGRINVDQPIKGNLWTTVPSARAARTDVPPQSVQTPIKRVNTNPEPGKRRTLDDATMNLMRAESKLEDAMMRQQAGVEPLPGERTGIVGGGTRLNRDYQARQRALARNVAEAKEEVRKAIAERDALK